MAPATPGDDHHRGRDHDRRGNHHTAAHWPAASNAIRSAPPPGATAVGDVLQQSGAALLNGGGQSGMTYAGRSDGRPAQRHCRCNHQAWHKLSH
jgi:hypothetical protein